MSETSPKDNEAKVVVILDKYTTNPRVFIQRQGNTPQEVEATNPSPEFQSTVLIKSKSDGTIYITPQ